METMNYRFRDQGQTIYDFGHVFWVVCPRCYQKASVLPLVQRINMGDTVPGAVAYTSPRRLSCTTCSYTADWHIGSLYSGVPVDWYFHQPLWLQQPCCGETLWAYNKEHLELLDAYIQARLRETLPRSTLVNRLPSWMTSRKNRATVLKGIQALFQLLD